MAKDSRDIQRDSSGLGFSGQSVVDHPRYADAEMITLVWGNLNTRNFGSLYQTFPPKEAFRLHVAPQLCLHIKTWQPDEHS